MIHSQTISCLGESGYPGEYIEIISLGFSIINSPPQLIPISSYLIRKY